MANVCLFGEIARDRASKATQIQSATPTSTITFIVK